jgi:hypothetical protein
MAGSGKLNMTLAAIASLASDADQALRFQCADGPADSWLADAYTLAKLANGHRIAFAERPEQGQLRRLNVMAAFGEHDGHTGLQPFAEALEPTAEAQVTEGRNDVRLSRRVDFHNALYIVMDPLLHPVSCGQRSSGTRAEPIGHTRK